MEGKPRYLPVPSTSYIPRIFVREFWTVEGTFLLQKISDFCKLIVWHEADS
jgi:hypothetical protein